MGENITSWNGIRCHSLAQKLTFDLSHRAQVLLKPIIKFGIGDRFKITGIDTARGCGVAAFTHARVVAQSTLIQVRMSQGILCWDPLWLENKHTGSTWLTRIHCCPDWCVMSRHSFYPSSTWLLLCRMTSSVTKKLNEHHIPLGCSFHTDDCHDRAVFSCRVQICNYISMASCVSLIHDQKHNANLNIKEWLTGSNTSILQRRWTASWVAWLDSV